MICPSCKKSPLMPTKIADGLAAVQCKKCSGYLMSMLSYRLWIEENPIQIKSDNKIEEATDTSNPIICPKCQKLMSKFRISGESKNKLDSCGNCGELWIDHGEWNLLQSLGLVGRISSILSQPWQNEIKQQENEVSYESRYENILGENSYTKVKEFRDWVNNHEQVNNIRNYINRIKH